eukprot:3485817-Pleurochrysis_carterae.AAC.1
MIHCIAQARHLQRVSRPFLPGNMFHQPPLCSWCTRCSDPEPELRKAALNSMISEIRTSTSSMTSVPKPLKFLRTHYGELPARQLPTRCS